MLCRNRERAEAALAQVKQSQPGADVSIVIVDLSELKSVREAAAEVAKLASSIDGLVCNAGIMMTPTRTLTPDGFEIQMAVNHLSHFLLAGLLFPSMTSTGRIVATSSIAHRSGLKRINFEDISFEKSYRGWTAYAQSKLANLMFGLELDRRLRAIGSDVKSVICHPGISATNLTKSVGPILRPLMNFGNLFISQSAEKGARPTLLAAADPDVKSGSFYGPTGMGQTRGPVGEVAPAPHATDEDAAKRLWEWSEEATGISWPKA